MLTSQFDYDLPPERIAQRPTPERDGARMLVASQPEIADSWVSEWVSKVPPGALVVVNDTRVMQCRLLGSKVDSGGSVEILLLRRVATDGASEVWRAMGRASKPLRVGQRVAVGGVELCILAKSENGDLEVSVPGGADLLFATVGHVPLPPYVRRSDDESDKARYQTVFARNLGSAAAPTAGLHLTQAALSELEARAVRVANLTLHVGAGTFLPVKTDHLEDHPMHRESYCISSALRDEVHAARKRGSPVIAVGTTVVRALESGATSEGDLVVGEAETELFIRPGYSFRIVDGLLTNFHAPRSTLLALVCAFGGQAHVMGCYQHAMQRGYRFLSYGDAMWLPERAC